MNEDMAKNGFTEIPVYFTYQLTGSGTGKGFIYDFGATDPRNVNADEIRAIINVAYLSGGNGVFGWTDYWTNNSDPNSGLFQANSLEPALDEAGVPRVKGIISAHRDIFKVESYLDWSVGKNRTRRIGVEQFDDDFWIIDSTFKEKPGYGFLTIMNRSCSWHPTEYRPSAPRHFLYDFGALGYIRECNLPAHPVENKSSSISLVLAPGEFRMFEYSLQPFEEKSFSDIAPLSDSLILSPSASMIGRDKVNFERTKKKYPPSHDKTDCNPKSDFVGKFSFDAKLLNKPTSPSFSGLTIVVAELKNLTNGKRENRLLLPNGRIAGEGDRFAFPQTDEYSDGMLLPKEYAIAHFDICLGSWDRFSFKVYLSGMTE
jgi:hypothetical protein